LLALALFAHTDTVTTVDALLSFVWMQMHEYMLEKWKCCCSIDYWILIAGAAF